MSNEPRDTVFIGKKPFWVYVDSTLNQLENLPAVNIKARGFNIKLAVDVAQKISRMNKNTGFSIGNIKLDSETLESNDGKPRNVSTIEIEIKRNDA